MLSQCWVMLSRCWVMLWRLDVLESEQDFRRTVEAALDVRIHKLALVTGAAEVNHLGCGVVAVLWCCGDILVTF
jgi:hypothetical protein